VTPFRHTRRFSSIIVKVSDQILADSPKDWGPTL
jgi:hypothetical protein